MRIYDKSENLTEDEKEEIALSNLREWCGADLVSDELKLGLEELAKDSDRLKSTFLSLLDFGTAGLRGQMGAGLSAMNVHTVALATKALAALVREEGGAEAGVAIACDSRNHSEEFSRVCAEVLAYEGVRVYKFDSLRPTPELSFAVRYYGCKAGINITASHNPKLDNGYKAYWQDGAQLPPPEAKRVSDRMKSFDIFADVHRMPYEEGVGEGLITELSSETDEMYLESVLACRLNPEAVTAAADKCKIIYTPLHGTGYRLVPEALKRSGFTHILTVPEQMKTDGNFPTVEKPNPQFREVFNLGIEMAQKENCDLIIATDPDADRCGICVRNGKGEFVTLTGNQTGALMLDYIIKARRAKGTLPADACAIKSLVTTELATAVCEKNGVTMMNVYTGFKYIGEKIKEFERSGEHTFIFGFEESYGYLSGTYARDKDAVFAATLLAEMAAFYSLRGKTLYDALNDMYEEYGFFAEYLEDIKICAPDFRARVSDIMDSLRSQPPLCLGGEKLVAFEDFKNRIRTALPSGEKTPITLESENMLAFFFDGGTKLVVRPSGTEPKIKLYYFLCASGKTEAQEKYNKFSAGTSFIKNAAAE